ncbi:MAG TPA: ferritin-like domain-containing protein [Steroidobacteraceae bacterium]|jgi:bacterioferritin
MADNLKTLNQTGGPARSGVAGLSDVAALRQRARSHMDEGAVTPSYPKDREAILTLLNEALATEQVCVLRYKRHYFATKGIHAKVAADEFLEHAQDEQQHADQIAQRIVQLGSLPDLNPSTLASRSAAEYDDSTDLAGMLKADLIAERVAIESYKEMIAYVGERDPTTRRMLEEILAKEEEHAEDISDLRQGVGQS